MAGARPRNDGGMPEELVTEQYLTVAAGSEATAELEVNRSRFLTVLCRVGDEEQARSVVERQRRARHDARHHCSAFALGSRAEITRSSDDGEPAGTAGAPILQALLGAGLSDVVAVVTRYFGGVLLGTGGLVRAYSGATTLAIAKATLVRRVRRRLLELAVPYDTVGRVEADLRARGVTVQQVSYLDAAVLTLVDDGRTPGRVAAATAGQGLLTEAGHDWVDLPLTPDAEA